MGGLGVRLLMRRLGKGDRMGGNWGSGGNVGGPRRVAVEGNWGSGCNGELGHCNGGHGGARMQLGGLGALQRWELELKVIRGSPGGKIQWGCNREEPGMNLIRGTRGAVMGGGLRGKMIRRSPGVRLQRRHPGEPLQRGGLE